MARRRRTEHERPVSLFSFQDIMAAVTGVMILVTLLVALEPMVEALLEAPSSSDDSTLTPDLEAARAMVQSLREEIDRRLASPVVTEQTLAELERQVAAMELLVIELDARREVVEASLQRARAEEAEAVAAEVQERTMLQEVVDRWSREQLRTRVRFLPGERLPKIPLFLEIAGDGCRLGELAGSGEVRQLSRTDSTATAAVLRLLADRSPDSHQVVMIARQDALDAFVALRDDLYAEGWEIGWQLWDAREGGFFDAPAPPEVSLPGPWEGPEAARPDRSPAGAFLPDAPPPPATVPGSPAGRPSP